MISEVRSAEKKIKRAIRNSNGLAPLSQVISQTHLSYHLALNVVQMMKERGDIIVEEPSDEGPDFILRAIK